ncbi:uncharacterized protein LOC127840941 [Dreissena polymorpha]|uniref:Uncharacterized protein n=1 Tax=Dreissena polymorpha TaxID=45954 RepID=A0A9D4ER54_DREPO|nr:uncharacterized protein LOC127840941 [Dreissena polymorpha]KAH3784810.1 hypothetical protein DPMN_162881 [Dreissena polymorpha]
MNAKQLCTFLVICLAASHVLGAPDFYGGGIGGGGNMAEYDEGIMDDYDVEIGGQMINGLGDGMMGKGDGRFTRCKCVPNRGWIYPNCPEGWTQVGQCMKPPMNSCIGCPRRCCR